MHCVKLGLLLRMFIVFLSEKKNFSAEKGLFYSAPSPAQVLLKQKAERHIQGLVFLPDHPEHVKYGEIQSESAPQRTDLGKCCDIAKQHHRGAGCKLGDKFIRRQSIWGLAWTFYYEPSG